MSITVIMTVEGALANLPPWATDDMFFKAPPSQLGLNLYRLFIANKDRVILLARSPNVEYVRQWLVREGYTSPYHILKCKPGFDPEDDWFKARFVESLAEGWRNPQFFDNDSKRVLMAYQVGLGICLLAEPDRVLHTASRPAWDDLVSSIEAAHWRRAEQEVHDGNPS